MTDSPSEDPKDDFEEGLDEVLLDFLRQNDAGNAVDRDTFLGQHPEQKEKLLRLLEAADWIEEMAGPTMGEQGSGIESSTLPETPSEGVASPESQFLSGTLESPVNEEKEASDPNATAIYLGQGKSSQSDDLGGRKTTGDEGDFSIGPLSSVSIADGEGELQEFPSLDNAQAVFPCRFGDYVLEKILGRGGMGVVYLAHQVALHRPVAIKMIRSGALASGEEVDRFYQEARSVAKLDHPNIITIYQCGESNGHHFFSMDYVPGTDLAKMLTDGPLETKAAVRYVRDVARAIQHAHSNGVVHRDLKPANVLIDEEDHVVITDFGLAKQLEGEKGLTATGAALGTPSYMSPEQAAGKIEDQGEAMDVYAMGAILFALLVGKPPFQADTVMQTMMQVVNRPAPRLAQERTKIHSDLDTIVGKCLEKQPSHRYASAEELADDLDRFLNGHPIEAKPPSVSRRFGFWFINIPIVAALTGGRQVEPSRSQRWAQNLMISAAIGLLFLAFFGSSFLGWFRDSSLPNQITIASGAPGGMYYDLAGKLSTRLQADGMKNLRVLPTGGSIENLRQLLDEQADVALMQESSIRADQVAVVAPLFFEPIHILVPTGSDFQSPLDFKGHSVVLGSKDSGTRQAALRLLKYYGITEKDIDVVDGDWNTRGIRERKLPMLAVIKAEQAGVSDLISSGEFRLLSLSDTVEMTLAEPMFRPFHLPAGAYRGSVESPVNMLATAAMLVVRKDAPSRLVEECLNTLYSEPPLSEGLIPRELAAEWQGLPYHPAARRYFDALETTP